MPKKSLRQALKESEQRNVALVQYIEALESQMKEIFLRSAQEHDAIRLILSPRISKLKKALADICCVAVPFCQEAEEMKLTQADIIRVTEGGGALLNIIPASAGNVPKIKGG